MNKEQHRLKLVTFLILQGVIEGCRAAFILFCSELFETSNKDLICIPQKILCEVSVLKEEKKNSLRLFL